jgi:hypothetical protein
VDSRPLKIFLIGPPDEHNSPTRRFPPPWSVEEADACFIVRDANRQALAYVYFEGVGAARGQARTPRGIAYATPS